ncbi:predicted protein [Plenodomus lingam JN3]|uniref:Predicted protein n=1 Tax=Leptosphaeria maculans (strain JN3 / isolate v23.1.3 / race Av1-4-5-6-7-8) TaxID=985895 RepID=E5AC28_LEPMJ|nr:predicted protein [Plenodomus lingam JN3]CBY00139.1 predicted protein [Plenodomus lingam JN3]
MYTRPRRRINTPVTTAAGVSKLTALTRQTHRSATRHDSYEFLVMCKPLESHEADQQCVSSEIRCYKMNDFGKRRSKTPLHSAHN